MQQSMRPRGAVIRSAPLIATRFAARFLNVTAPSKTLAQLAGTRRATQRGRGVEFDEVRLYAAGDDVRAIDWRVTARSGEPHTKLFHEERERPVLVAVDLRSPMKFGSRYCFKSVLAAEVAALVLWSALDRGERVGGLVFDDNELRELRPQRSRKTVLRLIGELERMGAPLAAVPVMTAPLGAQLKRLRKVTRAGATVFVISDFHDLMTGDGVEGLTRLARHCQVIAVRVSDRLEHELPPDGRYVVEDSRGRSVLDTADSRLRRRYHDESAARDGAVGDTLRRLRIPLIGLRTGDAPLDMLKTVFPGR